MYELEHSEYFQSEVLQWHNSMEEWDHIWFNFDYQLARDPFLGLQIPGTDLWALALETYPPITIYYSIYQERMTIRLEDIVEV